MRLVLVGLCASLVMLTGCKKPDPNSIEDQLKVLTKGKTLKEKERAVENLRKIGQREAVPGLIEALKTATPRIRGEIAIVLGELKDPAAVPALVEAIDLSVGDGADRLTKETNSANEKIARALGDIGDKAAVKPLVQLLKGTRNNYARIEAIGSLGRLGDTSAIPVLSDFATDENIEPLINKKAINALAKINHPDALPVYLKMMFAERRGLSFYPESSMGLFLLGKAASDRVLALLEGQDKELLAWAKERQIVAPAIFAKAAQLESDLQDQRSIPALLKLLKFEDDNDQFKLIVRMNAADSLGRMRAKEAVAPLTAMLGEEFHAARTAYVRALVQIGDASAAPKFVECAKKGPWEAREFCMVGLTLLGTGKDVAAFDGFVKDEPANFDRECNGGNYGDVDCAKLRTENVEARTKTIQSYQKALQTIAACEDAKCLEKSLESGEPLVRERAAYELGRRNAVASLPALFAAVKRPINDQVDFNPRFAAICAVDWITSSSAEAMTKAKGMATALEAQVEQESQKVLTQKIAEEVKRLAVKLSRADK